MDKPRRYHAGPLAKLCLGLVTLALIITPLAAPADTLVYPIDDISQGTAGDDHYTSNAHFNGSVNMTQGGGRHFSE